MMKKWFAAILCAAAAVSFAATDIDGFGGYKLGMDMETDGEFKFTARRPLFGMNKGVYTVKSSKIGLISLHRTYGNTKENVELITENMKKMKKLFEKRYGVPAMFFITSWQPFSAIMTERKKRRMVMVNANESKDHLYIELSVYWSDHVVLGLKETPDGKK